jgi:hypothetical protein
MFPSITDCPVQLAFVFDLRAKQHYSVSGLSEFGALLPLMGAALAAGPEPQRLEPSRRSGIARF